MIHYPNYIENWIDTPLPFDNNNDDGCGTPTYGTPPADQPKYHQARLIHALFGVLCSPTASADIKRVLWQCLQAIPEPCHVNLACTHHREDYDTECSSALLRDILWLADEHKMLLDSVLAKSHFDHTDKRMSPTRWVVDPMQHDANNTPAVRCTCS